MTKVDVQHVGERQQKVLLAVICEYIATAEPVGSRTIARKYGFNLSSATIRNIMADLEDMGLLVQPHTSAGRIPTDQGLRFYVDQLDKSMRAVDSPETSSIRQVLSAESELGDVMKKTSQLLSSLSNQAGIVLSPSLRTMVCRHIDFIKLSPCRVLAIFISESGVVQKRVIRLEEDITQDMLDKISRLLTSELMGLSVLAIRRKLVKIMETDKARFDALLLRAVKLSQEFFSEVSDESELYLGGTLNMMNQPEFADLDKMKALFKTFEEKRLLITILDKCLEDDEEHVRVIIGNETTLADMQDLGFVISSYKYGNRALGVIGIIGPKRMNYMQVIPIVDYTAKTVSRLLTDRMDV